MGERYIEGPNTYPDLRSRVAAYVGERMIQQSHVPMDIGEVEVEIEGSDDQIAELRGARKPRRDERSTHQRGLGNSPGERHRWEGTRSERQTTCLTGHREGRLAQHMLQYPEERWDCECQSKQEMLEEHSFS